MSAIESAFVDLLDYLGNYIIPPACLTAVGECTAVFAIACIIMSLFFRKGKADGVRTFSRILSVITLIFSVVLIVSFLGLAVLLFVGAGASGGNYHLVQPFYNMYYAFIAETICFGLPPEMLELSTMAVIGITLAFYAVMFILPSVLGFISFSVVRGAVRKSNEAKAKRQETVQASEQPERQYTRYPINNTDNVAEPLPIQPVPVMEQPVPEPVEESAQPAPEPVEEPVQPVPEPVAEPVQPVPEPVAEPVQPVPERIAEPVQPIPEPVAEPVQHIPEPIAEPVQPIPEPVEEPVQPIPEPVAEPAQPIPEPVEEPAQPIPEPVEEPAQPIPEPVAEPVQPAPEPVAEPAQPVPEPVAEPVQPEPFVPLFCMKCGTPLNGNDFCHNCGLKAGVAPDSFCTSCGAKLQPGSAFCTRCGKKL